MQYHSVKIFVFVFLTVGEVCARRIPAKVGFALSRKAQVTATGLLARNVRPKKNEETKLEKAHEKFESYVQNQSWREHQKRELDEMRNLYDDLTKNPEKYKNSKEWNHNQGVLEDYIRLLEDNLRELG